MARRVRRARGTISWRPERNAYFVRWLAPDGTRKQLRGGRTIEEAQAVLDAVFDDERRAAGGEPAERLLHEFLADEHLPALMARLAARVPTAWTERAAPPRGRSTARRGTAGTPSAGFRRPPTIRGGRQARRFP